MKINKVWAIYFSPTGTTEKSVKIMAHKLSYGLGAEIECYDFTLPEARSSFAHIGADDLAVFGMPTYAGRIPNVMLKYLETISGNEALAVPIVTFGNRNFDNSLVELRDILERAGFHPIAAAAISCEHSFSYSLGAGRPDSRDISEIEEFALHVAERIQGLQSLPLPVHVQGISGPAYGGYYKPQDRNGVHIDIRKVIPKVSENCNGCGHCAQICPMGSICADDIHQMQGICIKCGACVKKCPMSARYFDDTGYLYHKKELEDMYQRRASNSFFGG